MGARTMLSRRRLLAGAVTLPLLPERALHAAATPPPRVVFWNWPEGVIDDAWWPTAADGAALTGVTLTGAAAPLQPHRQDLTIVRGLEQRKRGRFEVAHDTANREILTGRVAGGLSLDQAIARLIAGDAPRRSYELGVHDFGDGGGKLWVSQDGPGAYRPAQNNPVKAFDDLVAPYTDGDGAQKRLARLALRRSVLDGVLGELTGLRCRLGRDGRTKLDAHVESVRAIERSIDRTLALPVAPPTGLVIDRALGAWEDRTRHAAIGKAQVDIMVAALRADVCRVLMLQWSHTNDNNLSFPWLPITYKGASHHALSHEHQGFGSVDKAADKAQTRRDRIVILEFWMSQLAYFVGELKKVPEGNGTLFDNTVIVGFSEHGSNNHRNTDLPFFLLGGGGRRFVTGRHFDVRAPGQRSHADFLTAVLRGYDRTARSFGEPEVNDAPLDQLLR